MKMKQVAGLSGFYLDIPVEMDDLTDTSLVIVTSTLNFRKGKSNE